MEHLSILLFPSVRRALAFSFRGHKMDRIPSSYNVILTLIEAFLMSYLPSVAGVVNLPGLKRALFHGKMFNFHVVVRSEIERGIAIGWLLSRSELFGIHIGKSLNDISGGRGVHHHVVVILVSELDQLNVTRHGLRVDWHPNGKRVLERLLTSHELVRSFVESNRGTYLTFNTSEVKLIPTWALTFQEVWTIRHSRRTGDVISHGFLNSQFIRIIAPLTLSCLKESPTIVRDEFTRGVKYVRDQTIVVDQTLRQLDAELRKRVQPHQVIENGIEIVLRIVFKVAAGSPKVIKVLSGRVNFERVVVPVFYWDKYKIGSLSIEQFGDLVHINVLSGRMSDLGLIYRSLPYLTSISIGIISILRILINVPHDVYRLLDRMVLEKNSNILYVVGNKGIGKTRLASALTGVGYHVFDSDAYGRVIRLAKLSNDLDEGVREYLSLSPSDRARVPSQFELEMDAIVKEHIGNVYADLRDVYSVILSKFREIYGELRREFKISVIFSSLIRIGMFENMKCDYDTLITTERFAFFCHTIPEAEASMAGVTCQLEDVGDNVLTLFTRDVRGVSPFYLGYALATFYRSATSSACPSVTSGWLTEIIRVLGL